MTDSEAYTSVVIDASDDDPVNHYQQLFEHGSHNADYDSIHYGDTCAIMWTSGTTGKSKGVMLSHNGWLRPIIKGTSLMFHSQAGDVIFNVLPMYHAAAWNTAILRALVEGIPVVLGKRFSVSGYWQQVNQFKATQGFTLGAMHMFLWNAAETEQDAATSMRELQAVPMPADIKASFERRFGLQILGSGFGQSECMMITSSANHETEVPEHSMGFAADDIEIKLFDDADQEVMVGEVGEIRLRPKEPHIVCNGYFDNPQATQDSWRDGWYCTGDLGRVDENGAYYFSDRKKDSVRFAGRNISTLEVESVARKHPEVADVAVFGIPSSELAEEDELKMDLILKSGSTLDTEQIARFINDNAPYYFVPRYIEMVAELPYTPTNKIQKYKLRERGVGANTWDRYSNQFTVERA